MGHNAEIFRAVEMTLVAIFYRMRNKPWATLRFLKCGRKQAFKSLDLRISVGFLKYCESCERYTEHPFPLLPVLSSCARNIIWCERSTISLSKLYRGHGANRRCFAPSSR